ncbi:MAG: radical SAM protein [Candidatus Omnitrophica bacterium]|nr:radical SAM protein [Candidatus Omnitrophota bacterium]
MQKELKQLLENCTLCPHQCRVNRLQGKRGFCRAGALASVYGYHLHQGEEPPISGCSGSGTIFFSRCNSRCVYCQNYTFSQLGQGKECSLEKLAQAMLSLQAQGAHNINLVSPTHFVPQIIGALELAKAEGLNIPLVYNTMAYDAVPTLKLLENLVDIYLADMRYADDKLALEYSSLPNFTQVNQAAIKEMYRQVGNLKITNGLAQRGLLVRLLVLPNRISGTKKLMQFLAKELSVEVSFSLMSQYYPTYLAKDMPLLARQINQPEWKEVVAAASDLGLENGWIQDQPTEFERNKFLGVNFNQVE